MGRHGLVRKIHFKLKAPKSIAGRLVAGWLAVMAPLVVSAEQWLDVFSQPVLGGFIKSATRVQDTIFVAGRFLSVGDQRANGWAAYDVSTNTWRVLELELDTEVRAIAGLEVEGETELYILPEFGPGTSILEFRQGEISERIFSGFVRDLARVQFSSGPAVVATGEFEEGALAVRRDGEWTYLAELAESSRGIPVAYEKYGQLLVAVLGQRGRDDHRLIITGGQAVSYIQLPGRPSGLAAVGDDLYLCIRTDSTPSVWIWDGLTLAEAPFAHNGLSCSGMSSRSSESGDVLVFDGGRRVSDGKSDPIVDLTFPTDCYSNEVRLKREEDWLFAAEEWTASSPAKFCFWDGDTWRSPEDALPRTQDQVLALYYQLNRYGAADILIRGLFRRSSDEHVFSLARWNNGRLEEFQPALEWSGNAFQVWAVSRDGEVVFERVGQDLFRRSASGSVSTPLIGSEIVINSPTFGENDGIELFYALDVGEKVQVYGFDGSSIIPIGPEVPGPPFSPLQFRNPLIYIPAVSAASGLYAVQRRFPLQKSSPASFRRILRLVQNAWIDITPAEFDEVLLGDESAQLLVAEFNGAVRLFAAMGEHFGYYDGVDWTMFPPLVGGVLNGPIAKFQKGEDTCFMVGQRSLLHRLCGGTWSTLSRLQVRLARQIPLDPISVLSTLTLGNREVMLVGGQYESAGFTTQANLAVLDLELLFASGFETP